jgi:hypothetical protein
VVAGGSVLFEAVVVAGCCCCWLLLVVSMWLAGNSTPVSRDVADRSKLELEIGFACDSAYKIRLMYSFFNKTFRC